MPGRARSAPRTARSPRRSSPSARIPSTATAPASASCGSASATATRGSRRRARARRGRRALVPPRRLDPQERARPHPPSSPPRRSRRRRPTRERPRAATTTTEENPMLNEPTLEKLKAMRLDALADAWREQQQKPDVAELAFDERFGAARRRRVARTARTSGSAAASRRPSCGSARPASRTSTTRRAANSTALSSASSPPAAGWPSTRTSLITGATGTGKTYLACALAQQACRKGYRAIYRRASRLFDELASPAPTAPTPRAARAPRPRRRPGHRRLGPRAHAGPGAPRPPRGPRRSPRTQIDRHDQPAAGREMARPHRRSHERRRHLRPRLAQRPPDRAKGAVPTEGRAQGARPPATSVASLRSR